MNYFKLLIKPKGQTWSLIPYYLFLFNSWIHNLDFVVPQTDSFIYQCNILLDFISCRWEEFSRTMFWLAIIGGSLILLHALLLTILKFRKQKQRGYGLLTFPRFEIFLVNLALLSICEASATLIRGNLTVCLLPYKWILIYAFIMQNLSFKR